MFNGDLDLESDPYNRWGYLKFIWKPYQKVFKHRSFFTHGPILGTMIRLLWIALILSPLLLTIDLNMLYLMTYEIKEILILILIGLELGSLSHSIADWLT